MMRIIQLDFYIDFSLSGSMAVKRAQILQCQVQKILSRARIDLKKWCTNSYELLRLWKITCTCKINIL